MARTTAIRTDEALWRQIVREITAGTKGGKAGQWSARKAQMAVAAYKSAGGGYIGQKSADNSLAKWTREDWRTKSGRPSLETGERYLPAAAIEALTDEEYEATTRAKRAGMRRGQQFVPQPYDIAAKVEPFRRPRRRHPNPMTLSLYANPYGSDKSGFHFSDYADLQRKLAGAGFADYSVSFVDGSADATMFCKAVPPAKAHLSEWFGVYDEAMASRSLLMRIVGYTACHTPFKGVTDYKRVERSLRDATVYEGDIRAVAAHLVEADEVDDPLDYINLDRLADDLEEEGYSEIEVSPNSLGGGRDAREELESGIYLLTPDFDGDPDNADDLCEGLDNETVFEDYDLEEFAQEKAEAALEEGNKDFLEAYFDYQRFADTLRPAYFEFSFDGSTHTMSRDLV
jgi:hypothetical protein